MPHDQDRQKECIERRQDAQSATKVEVPQTNVAVFLEFSEKQFGYQKSAYDKEYRNSEVTISKVRPFRSVFSVIGKQGVSHQNHRDRYGSKSVKRRDAHGDNHMTFSRPLTTRSVFDAPMQRIAELEQDPDRAAQYPSAGWTAKNLQRLRQPTLSMSRICLYYRKPPEAVSRARCAAGMINSRYCGPATSFRERCRDFQTIFITPRRNRKVLVVTQDRLITV